MGEEEKHAAAAYILGPINEPTPNEETGLGASFRVRPLAKRNDAAAAATPQATGASSMTTATTNTNPFRRDSSSLSKKAGITTHVRAVSTPVSSTFNSTTFNPSTRPNSFRQAAFANVEDGYRRRSTEHSRPHESSLLGPGGSGHRRRASSLRERFPGDPSVRPLDSIRRDHKAANRSPHLNRRHMPGADSIDKLDLTAGGLVYHHGGPYDAALLSRNSTPDNSPLAALSDSNREAIKATPIESVRDSVERHRPLDNVAIYPPGTRDMHGRLYEYEEGSNMMTEYGGDYKRYPGLDYHRDDIKGKGEPEYTIEKALKEHEANKHNYPEDPGYEMVEQPRKTAHAVVAGEVTTDEQETTASGSAQSTARRVSGEMRKRVGSLRQRIHHSSSD